MIPHSVLVENISLVHAAFIDLLSSLISIDQLSDIRCCSFVQGPIRMFLSTISSQQNSPSLCCHCPLPEEKNQHILASGEEQRRVDDQSFVPLQRKSKKTKNACHLIESRTSNANRPGGVETDDAEK